MNKPLGSEIYIGLMSGTSLDGIDVAIVDFSQFPPNAIYCETRPYSESLRLRLRELNQSASCSLQDLYSLDAELGECYAEATSDALHKASLKSSQIAAIGCHGQTIDHAPNARFAYSAQIGDPNRLAVGTGITTVADFRRKDIALGGQGAPLAPAFHRYLFASKTESRVLINIGGIANISYLGAADDSAILGFDTGPGNTLLDYWIGRQKNLAFDDQGNWAASGKVIDSMLERMLAEEAYFALPPPKSTGTEYFSPGWLQTYLSDEYAAEDVQATLLELTARTIAPAISGLAEPIKACFVCGGGAHNHYLLDRLRLQLPGSDISSVETLGSDPDFVEAMAFAWLARERIQQRSGNITRVTEARRSAILGGVYLAD